MARKSRDYARPVLPTAATVALAKELVHRLKDDGPRFVLQDRATGTQIEIDETIYDVFRQILINFSLNRPISLAPLDHELSTHQAASFLNVSRGYVLKLLNEKKIDYRKVGVHRRVRLEDLVRYKEEMLSHSEKALQELGDIDQELGL
jgi:excisionase family DNA binding protein